MKIYLAGPMRGIPEFNFPVFFDAAETLEAEGHEVFNPAERDQEDFGRIDWSSGDENALAATVGLTVDQLRRRVFLADMTWICREAECVALLPGWSASKGACAEKALGEALGLEIRYLGRAATVYPSHVPQEV